MNSTICAAMRASSNAATAIGAIVLTLVVLLPQQASAIPLFNRQTGQNCVACHAGGQFPELTPYGRLFKMTGYTIGQRTVPVSAMAVASYSKVADTSKSDDPSADFQKNGSLIMPTASLFLAGKITDNIGAFTQITYDNYATQSDDGKFHGHTNVDNVDIRFADRFIDTNRDVIVGVSVNNNPSVSDPWNTAPAWMQYVPVPSPTSSQFIDGNAPYPGYGSGGNVAGITAYAYWNQTLYAEIGGYRTADGFFRFMSGGLQNADVTKLNGVNPYWRLAFNHEWGAHSLMVGTSGMVSNVYDDPLDTSDSNTTHHIKDLGLDAQYQYLLDPHAVTAQAAYMKTHHRYPAFLAGQPAAFADPSGNALPDSNSTDTVNVLRTKLTYVYRARYGGSLGFFNLTGSTNTANQTLGVRPRHRRRHTGPGRVAGQRQFHRRSGHAWLDVRGVLDADPVHACRRAVHHLFALQRRIEQLRRLRPKCARQQLVVRLRVGCLLMSMQPGRLA